MNGAYFGIFGCQFHGCPNQGTHAFHVPGLRLPTDDPKYPRMLRVHVCADHWTIATGHAPVDSGRAILDLECQLRASLTAANDSTMDGAA